MLQAIDASWVDHLELMDYARNSVRLRAYGQRDPLVEYKNEGAHNANIERQAENIVVSSQGSRVSKSEVGRNDPCPCGAINPITEEVYKYKKCGLVNASYHNPK